MLKELLRTNICRKAKETLSSAIVSVSAAKKGFHYSVVRYDLENGYAVFCVEDRRPGRVTKYIQDIYTPDGDSLDLSVFFMNGREQKW